MCYFKNDDEHGLGVGSDAHAKKNKEFGVEVGLIAHSINKKLGIQGGLESHLEMRPLSGKNGLQEAECTV